MRLTTTHLKSTRDPKQQLLAHRQSVLLDLRPAFLSQRRPCLRNPADNPRRLSKDQVRARVPGEQFWIWENSSSHRKSIPETEPLSSYAHLQRGRSQTLIPGRIFGFSRNAKLLSFSSASAIREHFTNINCMLLFAIAIAVHSNPTVDAGGSEIERLTKVTGDQNGPGQKQDRYSG